VGFISTVPGAGGAGLATGIGIGGTGAGDWASAAVTARTARDDASSLLMLDLRTAWELPWVNSRVSAGDSTIADALAGGQARVTEVSVAEADALEARARRDESVPERVYGT
jgi:hypothetical protein